MDPSRTLQSGASDEHLRQAGDVVIGWKRPVLFSHTRPDGDALGCMLALRSLLAAGGRHATPVLYRPCPPRYAFMAGIESVHVLRDEADPVLANADGVIIVDTCAYSQLRPIEQWLRRTSLPRVAVDHHQTLDELADHYLIDNTAASCTLIVHRWARACGWPLTPEACEAIFVGLATDTGWFRFNNTTPEAFRAAAELVEKGASVDAIHKHVYLSEPASKLRLQADALREMELLDDDTVAVVSVLPEMFAFAGASDTDTEDLVQVPMTLQSVQVGILLVDRGDGVVKCSFRSKGTINAADLAASFGGGGHTRAAGARIAGGVAEVKQAVIEKVRSMKRG